MWTNTLDSLKLSFEETGEILRRLSPGIESGVFPVPQVDTFSLEEGPQLYRDDEDEDDGPGRCGTDRLLAIFYGTCTLRALCGRLTDRVQTVPAGDPLAESLSFTYCLGSAEYGITISRKGEHCSEHAADPRADLEFCGSDRADEILSLLVIFPAYPIAPQL